MKKTAILIPLTFFFLVAGCSKDSKVVAKIGKNSVTLKMVHERITEAPPSYRTYLDSMAGRRQFVDLMVREKIVMEDARRAGVAKRKDYIKSITDFKADQARRLREYEENLMMELFISDLHSNTIKAEDSEIEKYYLEHKKEYDRPVNVTVRHILLANRADAEAAMKRVKAGEDFVKLCKELSTDPVSAPNGGEIGPFKKGELVPEFEQAVFPLKIGQVSDIVETQFGFHIIKKISEKPLQPRPREEIMAEIKRMVEKNKFDAWIDAEKAKFKLKVNYDILKDIPSAPSMNEQTQASDMPSKTAQGKAK